MALPPSNRSGPDQAMPHVAVLLPVSGRPARDGGPDSVLRAAALAEEHGFDSVFVGDHLIHPQPMLESLTTLAVVAGHTDRIGLEVSVLQLALRQTAVVAKQLATLGYLAPGRLAVGIGVGGEHPAEWAACGVPRRGRGAATTAAARELAAVLAGQPASFADGVPRRLDPVPPQPVPLFFGGRREPALRRAATLGTGWVGWLHSPQGFSAVRSALHALRGETGASASFWYGMQVPVFVSGTRSEPTTQRPPAQAHRPTGSDGYRLEGTPDRVLAGLRAYWDAGCERFKLSLIDTARSADQVQALGRDVLPELRTWRRD
jgi:alkanesulfonate monooxygenase SsuD/methylene tetrahydromethanopterin reductase-like flavin-dependent oxidoreductase (luciferase family)